MDRNTIIGMTLMGALLLAYFYWFAPPPQQAPATLPTSGLTQSESKKQDSVVVEHAKDTVGVGRLAKFSINQEHLIDVETADLKIQFSSRGGIIRELELKNYKTYHGTPLKLVDAQSAVFQLNSVIENNPVNLYALHYEPTVSKSKDTTTVRFLLHIVAGDSLIQTYTIPHTGYQISYSIDGKGVHRQFSTEHLTFQWENILRPLEKDITDSRNNTTINYYTASGTFDYLNERSTDVEAETIVDSVKWISFKQKFFLAAIIAKNNFASGGIETAVNVSDTSVVKRAKVKLLIPTASLADGKASYTFYFGPNEYKTLGAVTEAFNENVYLGWPPVKYINKYAIRPIFDILVGLNMNYGVIILILVLLLRVVLLPLSYTSNISMAKMKVLKPDLDLIKEKHPDDMAKAQQEQMKLYQQVGVNPLSGCVPVLLQLPILMAMFYLFPNSIELRQQSLWWAEDLSTYDSILNLPFTIPFYGDHVSLFVLLMTATTLVYTWQNNQMTTVQGPMKSMSYIMPVVFIFVLNSFPAGLSYYYFISTLTTIFQQMIFRRFVDEDKIKKVMEENRAKIAAGGGKKSKFMSTLEGAMKASEEARRKAEEEKRKKK